MRIAVTGSSGFIGKNLVQALRKSGYDVVEISRGKGLDICQWDSLKSINSCDAIIHLAAKTFVPDSFSNPREFYQINNTATLNALELARLWKAKLIYMSSYFYGAPQYFPVDEKHPVYPHNPYAQSKLISEELCKSYFRDFGISVTAFRLFNLYGPGQNGSLLIPDILNQIETGKVKLKDPRPKRDFIHIDDVIFVLIKALKVNLEGFNIFNLGTGKSWSVEELVSIFKEISPKNFDVEFTNEYRQGEILDSVADINLLKSIIDWKDPIDLKEGLKTLFKNKILTDN
jgi:nucleoside-diphosphate-sugar epimerase